MFNTKKLFGADLRHVSLTATVCVTILFSLHQISWAAIIHCSQDEQTCDGTSGNDIIYGSSFVDNIIHGLAGNDYITASGTDLIYGDDGDDILIGSWGNDYLNGGNGNDKYDGRSGDDSIAEPISTEESLNANNDVISGGEGNDFIFSGLGADKIHGGPGNDIILPDGFHRDFSFDNVNCGSDTGDQILTFYSGDGDITSNCEFVTDLDR